MSKPHTDRITPASGQQMDRSNDPETTAEMDAAAPEAAMASRRQRLTGSAVGVGSVGFDESGAFDVGADDHDPQDDAVTDTTKP
ncbi:MAG: Tat pathway signal protein [Brevundimonas sp.]|uniref:Tat pathway signal protein n=1 Tax=Brevundimonas sp. TaxID=1871086 RepID=UPI00391BB79B